MSCLCGTETWPRTRGGRLSTAGTTASIAIVRDKMLYVANVGDSSVVIGELAANGCCVARTLTVVCIVHCVFQCSAHVDASFVFLAALIYWCTYGKLVKRICCLNSRVSE